MSPSLTAEYLWSCQANAHGMLQAPLPREAIMTFIMMNDGSKQSGDGSKQGLIISDGNGQRYSCVFDSCCPILISSQVPNEFDESTPSMGKIEHAYLPCCQPGDPPVGHELIQADGCMCALCSQLSRAHPQILCHHQDYLQITPSSAMATSDDHMPTPCASFIVAIHEEPL